MPGPPPDCNPRGGLTLVGEHGAHVARFADDGAQRRRAKRRQPGDQMRHTAAACLLVIGKGKVDRTHEPRRGELWNGSKRRGQIALHVGRSAAEKLVAVTAQGKGMGGPFAGFCRNDIHMAGEDIAGEIARPDRGEEIAAIAFRSCKDMRGYAMTGEIVADP